MNGTITCSINEAIKLMSHLSEDTMVTLTIVDKKTKVHNPSKRIKKRDSKKLLTKAEMIEYQDNDFFGRFSLYGTVRDKNIIQNKEEIKVISNDYTVLVEDKKFSEEFIKKYDYIVSVPIHSKRMHQRGYNQSKLIAKEIAKLTQKKYIDKVLIKIKNVEAQSSLNRISRIQNIKGVFELGKNSRILEGKNILIVDDIYTTGSTIDAIAKVLQEDSERKIFFVTLAIGETI